MVFEGFIQLLTSYGYWGMLLAAFLAGSFFPFSSEAVMVGLMAAGLDPWLLTATQLHALSWRSWLASLIGLLTPYWLVFFWLLSPFGMTEGGGIDLTPLADHFTRIADLQPSAMRLTLPHVLSIAATVLLATAGALHFWQYSYEDKIRIRLLYGFFSVMTAASLLMTVLMPSLYDVLMPIAFVTASPLAAHVMTFTSSRLSNILFLLAIVLLMAIAVVNTLQPPLG